MWINTYQGHDLPYMSWQESCMGIVYCACRACTHEADWAESSSFSQLGGVWGWPVDRRLHRGGGAHAEKVGKETVAWFAHGSVTAKALTQRQ